MGFGEGKGGGSLGVEEGWEVDMLPRRGWSWWKVEAAKGVGIAWEDKSRWFGDGLV